ncbi:MAG: phenylalanine--tRNA ligase subunit beta, partial [Candidatus Cloacimonetes bacterium]|nr:phenylalanine--tRNA ligase subunit beta [Candidatus Cloacimonadota bacterium]
EAELGISKDHSGIIELPDETPIGIGVNEILGLPDTILEVEITPNRPDLLGLIGIARDLSASQELSLQVPDADLGSHAKGDHISTVLSILNQVPELCPRYTARVIRGLKVEDSPQWLKERLVRAGLRPINNVVDITNFVMLETGHPLHAFDYDKLACPAGERIPQVLIRRAGNGEKVNALDDREYSLSANDMVIADPEKAIAVAGVIGLTNSHIEDTTIAIVIESAGFNPQAVRRTSYLHKISTDSSYRFERGQAPESAEYASARAAALILEIAGGTLCEGMLDDWQHPQPCRIIGIRTSRFERVIGYRLGSEQVKSYLCRLGLKFFKYATWMPGMISDPDSLYCFHTEQMEQGITEFTEKDDCIHTLYFEIPAARVDLEREIDLIEELARLDGYDKPQKENIPALIMDMNAHLLQRRVADYMVANGFFEAVNYSFVDEEDHWKLWGKDEQQLIRLKNPPSANQAVMRNGLIPGLLRNLQYNLDHGARDIALFELNKLYLADEKGQITEPMRLSALATGHSMPLHWQSKSPVFDIFRTKGILASLFEELSLDPSETYCAPYPYLAKDKAISYLIDGKVIACCGMIAPEIAAAFGIDTVDLKQDIWLIDIDLDHLISTARDIQPVYQNIPRYPAVERDLAFVVDGSVTYNDIEQTVKSAHPQLIRKVTVFDEYRGKQITDNSRSIAIRITIADEEKTLTDAAVENVIASVREKLTTPWSIIMR